MGEGNLSRAARLSGLTQPTLGRHIDELERALGLSLFTRSPRGLGADRCRFRTASACPGHGRRGDALLRAASGSAAEAKGVVRITAA